MPGISLHGNLLIDASFNFGRNFDLYVYFCWVSAAFLKLFRIAPPVSNLPSIPPLQKVSILCYICICLMIIRSIY